MKTMKIIPAINKNQKQDGGFSYDEIAKACQELTEGITLDSNSRLIWSPGPADYAGANFRMMFLQSQVWRGYTEYVQHKTESGLMHSIAGCKWGLGITPLLNMLRYEMLRLRALDALETVDFMTSAEMKLFEQLASEMKVVQETLTRINKERGIELAQQFIEPPEED